MGCTLPRFWDSVEMASIIWTYAYLLPWAVYLAFTTFSDILKRQKFLLQTEFLHNVLPNPAREYWIPFLVLRRGSHMGCSDSASKIIKVIPYMEKLDTEANRLSRNFAQNYEWELNTEFLEPVFLQSWFLEIDLPHFFPRKLPRFALGGEEGSDLWVILFNSTETEPSRLGGCKACSWLFELLALW